MSQYLCVCARVRIMVYSLVISQEEEAAELSKIMMTKKSKRLYERMQYGIEKKQAAVQVLQEKRKKIEAEEGARPTASKKAKTKK